jgi:Fe-S cluster assembly protein SufD
MSVADTRDPAHYYLASFESHEPELARVGSTAIHRLREEAITRFAKQGFPGPRDEEWRFTPLTPLLKVPFELGPSLGSKPTEDSRQVTRSKTTGTSLLCQNGVAPCILEHSQRLPEGVLVCGLAEALQKHAELVEPYLAHADADGQPFTTLNTAFLRDGAFVYVPAGKVVEGPIFLHFLTSAVGESPFVWHRRALVVLGEHSQATIVESYDSADLTGVSYFTNAVTEVIADKNAVVDHYKLQREGNDAFHMAALQVRLGRGTRFSSHAVSLGSGWARNDVNAVFTDEGGECTLNGLYQASGQQVIDNHTFIDHAYPRCVSHELYKGILDGKARGIFNGKIYVRQDAQKTDAKQTNQALLLSDDATINTKPQLEIYADDVKCTHGATVGQLDEESIFYLRSRGIGIEQARALLTYAFANDVISRIKVDSLRHELEQTFLTAQHLPQVESPEERS